MSPTVSALAHAPLSAADQRGAYALVRDGEGRVLVVKADNGRFYLPGGRIEPGERPSVTLAREILEECGWHADIGGAAGRGEQWIFDGSVRLSAEYWHARLSTRASRAPEHEAIWLSPTDAQRLLHRDSDRRAVAALG